VEKIKKEYKVDLEDRRQDGSLELYEDTEADPLYEVALLSGLRNRKNAVYHGLLLAGRY